MKYWAAISWAIKAVYNIFMFFLPFLVYFQLKRLEDIEQILIKKFRPDDFE